MTGVSCTGFGPRTTASGLGIFGLSNLFVFLVGRRITHSRSYSQWQLLVLLEVFLEPYSISLHVILPIGAKITYTRKETGSQLLKCSPCPEADPNFPIEYPRPLGMYGNYVNALVKIHRFFLASLIFWAMAFFFTGILTSQFEEELKVEVNQTSSKGWACSFGDAGDELRNYKLMKREVKKKMPRRVALSKIFSCTDGSIYFFYYDPNSRQASHLICEST